MGLEPTTPMSRVSSSAYCSMRRVDGDNVERVVNPGSDLIDDLQTPLSWLFGDHSIHYNIVNNW